MDILFPHEEMIAFVCAIWEEIAYLNQLIASEKLPSKKGYSIYKGRYSGREILILRAGVGKGRVEEAVRLVLKQFPISTLISMGFAGALVPWLKEGDIILCHTLYCPQEKPCHSDPILLSKALKIQALKAFEGDSLTVSEPIIEAEQKRRLGETFPVHVVDMEGYWVGKIASLYGIPFLSIKAISDAVDDSLPYFIKDIGSRGMLMGVFAYLLKNPLRLVELLRLRGKALKAGKNLCEFILAFLDLK